MRRTIGGLLIGVLLIAWMFGGLVFPAMAQGTGDTPKLPNYDTMMTLFIAAGMLLLVAVGFLLGKHQGLDNSLRDVQKDTGGQTKIEGLLFEKFGDDGMALLRSGGMGLTALLLALAPEDWDETLERAKDIFDRLTDGQENLPPA